MAKISKSGIGPQQQIKSEHITRIIDALSGNIPDTEIDINGSIKSNMIILEPNILLPETASIGSLITFVTGSSISLLLYDGNNWNPLFLKEL
jgi:hypothetical protein